MVLLKVFVKKVPPVVHYLVANTSSLVSTKALDLILRVILDIVLFFRTIRVLDAHEGIVLCLQEEVHTLGVRIEELALRVVSPHRILQETVPLSHRGSTMAP